MFLYNFSCVVCLCCEFISFPHLTILISFFVCIWMSSLYSVHMYYLIFIGSKFSFKLLCFFYYFFVVSVLLFQLTLEIFLCYIWMIPRIWHNIDSKSFHFHYEFFPFMTTLWSLPISSVLFTIFVSVTLSLFIITWKIFTEFSL